MSDRVAIVGGGHNGLVAAALLARSGREVVLLEARSELGGLASTRELIPDHRVDVGSNDLGMFRRSLIEELELLRYGLELIEAPAVAAVPAAGDSAAVVLWPEVDRTAEGLASDPVPVTRPLGPGSSPNSRSGRRRSNRCCAGRRNSPTWGAC